MPDNDSDNAFNKDLELSDALQEIVGTEKESRPKVTKKVWEYIKDNDLQDSEDKRNINADDNLRPIFGQDQVSMFEMTKLISEHLNDPDA